MFSADPVSYLLQLHHVVIMFDDVCLKPVFALFLTSNNEHLYLNSFTNYVVLNCMFWPYPSRRTSHSRAQSRFDCMMYIVYVILWKFRFLDKV